MKSIITLVVFAIFSIWHISVQSQTFVKVTNSPLCEPMEAFGVSWGDFDNDGDQDVFINAWSPSPSNPSGYGKLFKNNCNGEFTRVTALPGGILQDAGTSRAVSWIDIDNDGDFDLYISHDAGINNSLYINNDDGTFTKETQLNIVNDQTFTRGHAWADFNNDGYLDLFLANDGGYRLQNDMLFMSDGNGGYIQNTTDIVANDHVRSDDVDVADIDNDGDMDIVIAVQGGPTNILYRNNGNGTFTKDINTPITNYIIYSYSSSWVDIDNDLDLDIFEHASFYRQSYLCINDGYGNFTRNATDPLVQNYTHSNGGETWGDYDNDGDIDVFVCDFYKNQLYSNNGNGTFTAVTTEIVTNDNVAESYGATWCDFDKDGDLDLLVPNAFGNPPNYFYINTFQNTGNANHWVDIKCSGTETNRSAIGARVYVKATINGIGKWQMREINANHSTMQGGQNPLNQHFGIGNATTIDTLKIYWPTSQITQIFTNITPDRYIEITEGDNTIYDGKQCTADLPIRNPGIVKGKLYKDVNNNCEYNDSIDNPIANRLVKAEPGPYYVFTNDSGEYTFELPQGDYNISLVLEDSMWIVNSCQSNNYNVTVNNNDTIINKNFGVIPLSIIQCSGSYNLVINPIPDETGPCAPLTLTSPCPCYDYHYFFQVTNNTGVPSSTFTVLSLVFPPNFVINRNPFGAFGMTYTPIGGSTIDITINASIPIGGNRRIEIWGHFNCPPYNMPAGGWVTTANYTDHGVTNTTNLIVNGDFNLTSTSPNPIIPVGFTADNGYNFEQCAPASGRYGVAPTGEAVPHCPNNFPWRNLLGYGGSGNLLWVDGHGSIIKHCWVETIPVSINTTYNFSVWFSDMNTIMTTADPNLEVFINGTSIITTGTTILQQVWTNYSNSWYSGTATSALIEIRSLENAHIGNDFAIDHIEFFEAISAQATLIENSSCSCDPNDKLVNPVGCGPNHNINKNETLKYSIRFQNTGTGPAHNIILSDKIDSNLDITTFKLLATSHTISDIQILPGNNLIIKFNNIELPDSGSNMQGSMGYVAFSISPKSGIVDGTVITNQAGIYFDRNAVVLTNTVFNTLYDNPTPDARFNYEHNCTNTGLVYNFNYTGNTPDNATFNWVFEDASPSTSTSTLQNPANIIFNSTGYKYVTLTVSRNGCTKTVIDSILINSIYSDNNKKVTICHNGNTITVSVNSLSAHLAHGDCVGECSNNNKSEQSTNHEIENNFENNIEILLIPNPNNGIFTVEFDDDNISNSNKEIVIYDILGNIVYKSYIKPQFRIDLSKQPKGIYLYKINSENKYIKSGKLIIQ